MKVDWINKNWEVVNIAQDKEGVATRISKESLQTVGE